MAAELTKFDRDFLKSGLALAARSEVDHLLYVSDHPPTPGELRGRPLKRKLIYAVTHDALATELKRKGYRAVVIPAYDYSRLEKMKIALVAAASEMKQGDTVLCMTGEGRGIDTLIKTRVGAPRDEDLPLETLKLSKEFDPQVVEQALQLGLKIGQEGFEGHPVGTILVIGDSTNVMEKSKQLTLNPFQGISETERNVLDPTIREAIKNFAVLDGAFIIREDGVVLAAGRYLQSTGDDVKIPLGLGARHAAGAVISATTKAIAVVCSQSSGAVRVFRGGEIALELHQRFRRS